MKEPIHTIMTVNVHTVQEDNSLHEVIRIFRSYKIRHLPVLKGDQITGIISRTDINRLTFGALMENQEDVDDAILDMLGISQVMSSKPRFVSPATSIGEVAEIFLKEEFHALPVVENNILKGIITTTDIIRYLIKKC